MSDSVPADEHLCHLLGRRTIPLYGAQTTSESLWSMLLKADNPDRTVSNQKTDTGRQEAPINRTAAKSLMTRNVHHAACIKAKVNSTVGLGFRQPGQDKPAPDQAGNSAGGALQPDSIFKPSKEDKVLNPLCKVSWASTLRQCCEDFNQVGTGYLEVVRNADGGEIKGIYHMPGECVDVYLTPDGDRYFRLDDSIRSGQRAFPAFGEAKEFQASAVGQSIDIGTPAAGTISEIIDFPMASSHCLHYGYPDWIAATVAMEIVACMDQYIFDYFLNRGVPEFLLFLMGQKLGDDEWTNIKAVLNKNVGTGNSHKSGIFNLAVDPNAFKVELIKLAMEQKTQENFFNELRDSEALRIVSAHGVPPLLAQIVLPGKIGATNELPNALMAFQVLVIAQYQRLFTQRLVATLGDSTLNGGLGLGENDFRFNTIVDHLNLTQMDTIGRMKDTVPEAAGKGRNISAGLKE